MVVANSTLEFITAAKKAGLGKDQLTRFMEAGYIPQPKQMAIHAASRECDKLDGPTIVASGGTRGQAKSHAFLAQAVIDDMQRVPGLKFLYLRKIQKKAGESFEDLRRKVLSNIPHKMANGVLSLPNGSFMIMGGFNHENQIDGYLGIEYDGLLVEDATSLTDSKIDMIFASIRTSKDNWRPRKYMSANPGGVGHQWFKQRFYDPYKRGKETESRFIHVQLGDNKFINPEYETFLNRLTGWLKRAWADGDFEISAGQFFTTFDEAVHVIEPKPWDDSWVFWASLDYGFNHWTVAYLFGMDADRNIYVMDEHAQRKYPVEWHCRDIKAMLERNNRYLHNLSTFVAGSDVFAQRQEGPTIADQYRQHGINLSSANMDRVNGAARILSLLGDVERGIRPKLFIFDRCKRLIETLPQMQHDPKRTEDVLKIDCDSESGEGGDDFYDAVRYGLMEQIGVYGWRDNPLLDYRG